VNIRSHKVDEFEVVPEGAHGRVQGLGRLTAAGMNQGTLITPTARDDQGWLRLERFIHRSYRVPKPDLTPDLAM
jgi:hypothetical protein